MPIASAAAIIIRTDENGLKILLTLRKISPFKNKWCLPGGHIDPNEPAREAIIREVKEETGLNFSPQLFGSFEEIFPEYKFHAVVTVFEGLASGKLRAQATEVKEIKWFPILEACSMELAFEHKKILNEYVAKKNSPEHRHEMLQEYITLRNEIIRRTELRNHILTFTLIIAGTFLSVGAQKLVESAVLLIYPILATFLTATWAQLDIRIGEIGEYIRINIEEQLTGIGWEHYMRNFYAKGKNRVQKRLVSFSAGGIFLGTQLLAVILAYYLKLTYSPLEIILLSISLIGFLTTIFLILIRRRTYKEKSNSF